MPNHRIWLEDKGCCIRATRTIKPGEIIVNYEETSHRLVTKTHALKHWEKFEQFFRGYCCPITDELYIMWDNDPSAWKPINHSCDPNAWVDGLNLTARREIKLGDEICIDYSILYTSDEQGPSFTCKCGSSICRGSWKGTDYLQAWFTKRYGDHVSEHVKLKQKQLLEKR